jgi:hypothetical protein
MWIPGEVSADGLGDDLKQKYLICAWVQIDRANGRREGLREGEEDGGQKQGVFETPHCEGADIIPRERMGRVEVMSKSKSEVGPQALLRVQSGSRWWYIYYSNLEI